MSKRSRTPVLESPKRCARRSSPDERPMNAWRASDRVNDELNAVVWRDDEGPRGRSRATPTSAIAAGDDAPFHPALPMTDQGTWTEVPDGWPLWPTARTRSKRQALVRARASCASTPSRAGLSWPQDPPRRVRPHHGHENLLGPFAQPQGTRSTRPCGFQRAARRAAHAGGMFAGAANRKAGAPSESRRTARGSSALKPRRGARARLNQSWLGAPS